METMLGIIIGLLILIFVTILNATSAITSWLKSINDHLETIAKKK